MEIHQGDGQVRVQRKFGFLSIDAAPGAGTQVLKIKGVGLVAVGNDLTLGYYDAAVVTVPPKECRLIVWISEERDMQVLDDLVQRHPEICAVEGGNLHKLKQK